MLKRNRIASPEALSSCDNLVDSWPGGGRTTSLTVVEKFDEGFPSMLLGGLPIRFFLCPRMHLRAPVAVWGLSAAAGVSRLLPTQGINLLTALMMKDSFFTSPCPFSGVTLGLISSKKVSRAGQDVSRWTQRPREHVRITADSSLANAPLFKVSVPESSFNISWEPRLSSLGSADWPCSCRLRWKRYASSRSHITFFTIALTSNLPPLISPNGNPSAAGVASQLCIVHNVLLTGFVPPRGPSVAAHDHDGAM